MKTVISSLNLNKRYTLIRKTFVLLLGIFLSLEFIFCESEKFETSAVKTNTQLLIDGILDEEVWQTTPSITNFIQFEPNKEKPASLKTVVKILYDDNWIYFGFKCWDPEPEKIVLGMSKRDSIKTGTDSVTVSMDTFNDKRTCYFFRTNPLGIQYEGRATDSGQTFNDAWDCVWKSGGSLIKEGWSAEIAIPFKSIKFQTGKNRTWGIQFSRYIPRRLEKSFWTGPLENYHNISSFGSVISLNLEQSHQMMEVIPHIISRVQETERADFQVGLDARYAFSQNISGHLTLNPDFATIEADQEQVNLTRFELNLLEKRNFFLEGNEIYQQRIRLFYSRRITDIYGGLKLYGKIGGYEIDLLSVQTKKDINNGESTNFSVVRLKRDIMKSSNIGFLAANNFTNGKNRGTFGADTSLVFTRSFKFTGQLALSYGDGTDLAFFIRPTYDTSTFHTHFRYTYLGLHFGDNANAIGFIRDDNRHEFDSALKKIFWLKKWGLERIEYNSNYNIYWGTDQTLRSWNVFQSLTLDFQNKFRFKFRHDQEYKLYEKKFRNQSSILELGYKTREWESVILSYKFGKNFDSDFTLISGRLRQNISRSLSLEYNLTKLSYSPDPENRSTWIHVIRATQHFTNDLFFKIFYQINSTIDKRNIQAVFVYRFQPPFGSIQLAYQKGTATFGEKGTQDHTLFLKLAYIF